MKTMPFWAAATLVSDSELPLDFQVSLEDMVSNTGRLVDSDLSQYSAKGTPFTEGDVLFGKLRPYLAKYWLADRDGTAGGDIHVYRPGVDVEPRYLAYIVGSRNFVRFAEAASKGVKMPRAEWMSLREYPVTAHGLDTQRAIADYLDRETGEIDAMVAKMDELAEVLQGRRNSTISNEVWEKDHGTRSLSPFWNMVELVSESSEPQEFQVSLEDMVSNSGRLVEGDRSSYSAKGTIFQQGDVLFGKLRPYLAKYWLAEVEGTAGGDIHVYRPNEDIFPKYLAYVIGSRNFITYTEACSKGTKMPRVEWMSLRELRVPNPSLDEQRRIADHLDEVTSKIDTMLAKVAELKSLLIERRAALITDVVTGRKEVA